MGGRWSHLVRRASHSRRQETPPQPASRHVLDSEPQPYAHSELRRSSRLVNHFPRSDYTFAERWSYGPDVTFETRYDTPDYKTRDERSPAAGHHKRGRTSSHDRKKRKTNSVLSVDNTDDCVAYCTRSRTALKSNESACDLVLNKSHNTTPDLGYSSTLNTSQFNTQFPFTNQGEGGLLPLEDRDFAYSPFSTSTVTDLIDSDYSVYSPTTSRNKGKKRKRSAHRSLSNRKNNYLVNLEQYTHKKFKIESSKESKEPQDYTDWKGVNQEGEHKSETSQSVCSYPLRNRHNHPESGQPTSTVTRDSSGIYLFLLQNTM